MAASNLVLRVVYLSASVDDRLSDEAKRTRTSRADLMRRYIEVGVEAVSGQVTATAATSRPAKKAANELSAP